MTSQTPEVDTTEVEEVLKEFNKILDELVGTSEWMVTKSKRNGYTKRLRTILLSQQQKHREAWLREEIVKLKKNQEDLRESCRGSYKIIVLTKEMEGFIDALQTIIDRYQSELDQPNK